MSYPVMYVLGFASGAAFLWLFAFTRELVDGLRHRRRVLAYKRARLAAMDVEPPP